MGSSSSPPFSTRKTTAKDMAAKRLCLHPLKAGDVLLKGVVFDMDGTMVEPQTWMFGKMRSALGIDKSIDILDHVYSLPTHEEQETANEKLRVIEREAMVLMKPRSGLLKVCEFLDNNHIPKAICTRNFKMPVNYMLTHFLNGHEFNPVITRDFRPPKPSPVGILKIAKSWNTNANSLIMIGDSIDDMVAGKSAGATTILLETNVNHHIHNHESTDIVIHSLDDLIPLIENGIPL